MYSAKEWDSGISRLSSMSPWFLKWVFQPADLFAARRATLITASLSFLSRILRKCLRRVFSSAGVYGGGDSATAGGKPAVKKEVTGIARALAMIWIFSTLSLLLPLS